MHYCSHCKATKEDEAFAPSCLKKSHPWCRECYRFWYVQRSGGMVQRRCDWCGAEMSCTSRRAAESRVFCSRACKDLSKNAASAQRWLEAKPLDRRCVYCGVEMPQRMRADARYCSKMCLHAAHGLKRGNERLPRGSGRRREILRAYVIERDGSRCHICGRVARADDLHLDHVVPLSVGGSHDESNLRVAHAACNLRKGNRAVNDQLMMVG